MASFSSPLISVRALSPAGDPYYGNGTQNFLTNIDAVVQCIATSIKLLQGEWFLNTKLGTPLWQSLVSHPITTQAVALIFQNIILSVPYVQSITSLKATYIPQTRGFSFSATVVTAFGTVTVSG